MKLNFYDMLIKNPEFATEIKKIVTESGFEQAVDLFIRDRRFIELSKLSPFYMRNRTSIDAIVDKYNV
jgi:hypothetical protein